MVNHYFKTAWRNLVKSKGLFFVNMTGLVVGIASSIVLISYVTFQFGYDGFNAKSKELYRVDLSLHEQNKLVFQSAENYPALAPALKRDLPEVADAARLYNMGYKNNCVFTVNSHSFRETKFMYADGSFFRMFSYPFLKGDGATALDQPFSAVISATLAGKLFGNESPIGKSIKMDDDDRNAELCKITGVFKDVPQNSHLPFNILISYNTLYSRRGGTQHFENGWDRKDFYTYVLLRPGTDPALVEAKLPGLTGHYMPEEKAANRSSVLHLEPLSKIHVTAGFADEPGPTANAGTLSLLIVIAAFIVTIAWVNYINMTTAGSVNRAKEIGIRKVLGSGKNELIKQFLIEAFTINIASIVLGACLAVAGQPFLDRFFHMEFSFSHLLQNGMGWIFAGFVLLGTILSGLYPALVLSSFKPVAVLKGKVKAQPGGILLRKALVVFQFALSIFLIIGTLVVHRQVRFMVNKDLGMNLNQVMVLNRPGKWDTARVMHNLYVQRFKEAVAASPLVESIGMSDELPGKEIRNPGMYRVKNGNDQGAQPIKSISIDEHFLKTLEFRFLAGRNFSTDIKTDKDGLILTASAVRQLGFRDARDAIGKEVEADGRTAFVIGVTNDFNQLSLETKTQPIIFEFNNSDAREFEYYLVKIKAAGASEVIGQIESSWNAAFKGNPFSFSFLHEDFNRQYRHVIQFEALFAAFALVAISIACIGLFSLLALMIQQRVKEIGIRKLLGATVRDVVFLLSRDFLRLVLLANILAWPLAWLLMGNWLKDFAYRIDLSVWIFALAGLAALSIALVTISIQSARAALANPIKSLKTEG